MPEGQLPKDIRTSNTPLDKARRRRSFLKTCEFEKNYRDRTLKNLKYFTGEDQGWDDKNARANLEAKGRPAITLNRIAAIMRLVEGNRPKTEASFTGIEDGDVETAPILTAAKDHIDRTNRWHFMENEWFKRGMILMRSVAEIYK